MHDNQKPMILIVEDEPKLAQLLSDYLQQSNFQTHYIENGLEVEPWVKDNAPNLVLLDIMLPGKDGMTICKDIRKFSDVPIIMVTARIEEIDRLLGLELGADDYVCKPFSPREVVARVKAVLKRVPIPGDTHAPANEPLEMNTDTLQVSYLGETLGLTAVEFRLLHTLSLHRGKVYSRDQLLDYLYDDHRIVTVRTIDTHIKNLRKKMEAINPDNEIIHSVYGVGYKLEL